MISIKKGSENYCATIVEINNLHPIEGADNIVRTVIYGNNVIISKDVQIGTKMVYFNSGTKLNPEFCKINNLYSNTEYNQDTTAKPGYLSYKQHRVKALKLRGVISDGFLLPINSLDKFLSISDYYKGIEIKMDYNTLLDGSPFKVGDTFTTINGVDICEKYIVQPRNNGLGFKASKAVNKFNRLVDNQFYLHNDTENLRRNIHKLNPNDIIGIHYKKHGTSAVIGNVLVKKKLNWFNSLLKRFSVDVVDVEYDIVYSSRKVIKNQYINNKSDGGYYDEDIWNVVAEEVRHLIPKGWTLYGEIVGYLPSGSSIQGNYDYGCKPLGIQNSEVVSPQHKFYVYKISVVNSDGKVIYLTDKQIEEYCEKVGLLYKDTFIYYGRAIDRFNYKKQGEEWSLDTWREKFLEILEATYNEKDCYMCSNKVPEEGIVIRVEHLDSYEAYKLKSKRFLLMESDAQEKDEVNIEDEDGTN